MLRSAFVASLLVACVAAAPAHAAPSDPCTLPSGPHEYQATLLPLLGAITTGPGQVPVVQTALGTQFAMLWLDSARQGWSVGLFPGPLDADAARAAIVQGLHANLPQAQADGLEQMLHVVPQTYGGEQLMATVAQVQQGVDGLGFEHAFVRATQCGEQQLVVVSLSQTLTPEQTAALEQLLVPYGDEVRYQVMFGGETLGGTVPVPPSARPYVSVPKASQCVRGKKIHVKPRPGITSLTLNGRKTFSLKLTKRTTPVQIVVTKIDGTTATLNLVYRRC
jgi:hypothetical protein